jgi:hypothetical protein
MEAPQITAKKRRLLPHVVDRQNERLQSINRSILLWSKAFSCINFVTVFSASAHFLSNCKKSCAVMFSATAAELLPVPSVVRGCLNSVSFTTFITKKDQLLFLGRGA